MSAATAGALALMINLGPLQQAVLDKIASGESRSYSDLFGGHQFTSFSDHPRVKVPLKEGLFTTAAGRYGFIAPTWDAQKARLGLPDFSPKSQDQAAWDLASRTYQAKTGRDLAQDQEAGRVDWSVLAGQWSSLRKSPPVAPRGATALGTQVTQLEPKHQLDLTAPAHPPQSSLSLGVHAPPPPPRLPDEHQFQDLGRGAVGMGTAPQDPRREMLLSALSNMKTVAQHLDFVPVDYDPWTATKPRLMAVPYNPFQPKESFRATRT